MTIIPTLDTERLTLRPWREADFPAYVRLVGDAATARFIGGACSAEDAWRRMATLVGHWQLRGFGVWVVAPKPDDAFAGYCGLWYPHGFPEPELAWSLLPEHQGRGLATEAALCARSFAYRELAWRTLMSVIAHENRPSQRVAARLGAVPERDTELRGASVALWRHPPPDQLP